ncbi:MAG: 5' nucleotidase, NT5C type [Nanobdellota archaeon]
MRIGIDIDDVIVVFWKDLQDFHNEFYGSDIDKEDIDFNLSVTWNCSKTESEKRLKEYYDNGGHRKLERVKGARENIEKLSKKHKLFIITSRHLYVKNDTIEWIQKNFPDIFSEILFTKELKMKKWDICKKKKIDLHIDDSPDVIKGCSDNGVNIIAFDYPWNKKVEGCEILRVNSWKEITNYIENNHT